MGESRKMSPKNQQREGIQLPGKTSKKPAGATNQLPGGGVASKMTQPCLAPLQSKRDRNGHEGSSNHTAQPQSPHTKTRAAPENYST